MDQTQILDNEQRLFMLLDEYMAALSDEGEDRPAVPPELLAAYPELADMLGCIESLESMAAGTSVAGDAGNSSPGVDDPPRQFARYELLNEVGRGGMGVVFEARHPTLDSSVALKVIRSGQFASQDEINRFYSEAQMAAQLRHPNIVAVHDIDEWEGEHFLTMDLVRGCTLAELLNHRGPMEARHAAEMLSIVARAVEYLHQNKVVHRDLKPSNIMLDDVGVPYVTDFGLAKAFERDSTETATGTIIGTASYMSPEQAAGRSKQVSPRSDVYSLGAILYEMLTGKPPFREENPLDTLLQVMESEPEPIRQQVPTVPAELEAICRGCLEKAPEARLESAARLADELDRFLRNEPLQLAPRSRWDRIRSWTRREPALSSRLAIISAGALVIQGNYWMSPERIPFDEHVRIMSVVAAWVATCVVCQRLMIRESWESRTPYVWAFTDVFFLTTILVLARPGKSIGPIVIGYPFIVVASGLWFEVRLVWLMTILSCLGYLLVNVLRAEPFDPVVSTPSHYPYIYAVVLCGIGYIVAYQVGRIRALSRYFERRREP